MNKIKELIKKYRELITYIITGGCTTLVNWVIYTLLTSAGTNMTVSNAIAWFGAVIFAFFANKLWVFRSKSFEAGPLIKEAVSFLASRILTGVIEIFLPGLLFDMGLNMSVFGIKGAVSKFTVSVIVIIANYIFGKLIVFRKNSSEKNDKNN